MTPDQLLAAALAQRAQWVDLGAGKRVRVRRPSEWDTRGLLQRDADGKVSGIAADLPEVKRFVVGWEGFKECDLIASGADDPVDFHADLWAVYVEDDRKVLATVAQAIIDAVIAHETARIGIEKN
jgi:hypothetical protein